jgi:glucokinase
MLHLGADVGGTNARVAAVEATTGRLVRVAKAALPDRSVAGVVATVKGLVEQLAHVGSFAPTIGVGVAGMVRGPIVVNAPNLSWRDADFGTALSSALGRPARLINDLSAAAWGERAAGVARGLDDTFTVFVGTGVGSAIISRGHLIQGATGVAAEFGHTKVVAEGGRPCGCGEFGCLEAYAGGARLELWMKEVGLSGTPKDLERLAGEGHPLARTLYDTATTALGLAIANQVTMLNPAMVVLGGGVLNGAPGITARIRALISQRSGAASREQLRVELAALGDDSGIVGAALLGG